MKQGSFSHSRQRGAVLLVALIMLLLLTILGAAAMRDTNLQERMAGNMRDHDLAFQAAEAALRFAEQEVKTDYANLVNDALYPVDDESPDVVTFTGFNGGVYGGYIGQLNLAGHCPKRRVEYIGCFCARYAQAIAIDEVGDGLIVCVGLHGVKAR